MATIQTSIELQDRFSGVLNGIIRSVNLSLSAVDDLNRSLSSPVDVSSLEGARAAMQDTTMAAMEMSAAFARGVEAPVVSGPTVWQTDTQQVFQTTGADRFRQEVTAVNASLAQLGQTQTAITAAAAGIEFFPADANTDLNALQGRLTALQSRIQDIASDPVNLVSDAASGELERLRAGLAQAVTAQDDLNAAVQRMDVGAANAAYLRLSGTVGDTERYIRDNVDAQGRFTRAIEAGAGAADGLWSRFRGIAATVGAGFGLSQLTGLSDRMTGAEARLSLIVEDGGSVAALQEDIYRAAMSGRSSFLELTDTVAKLGLTAGDAFSGTEEMVRFSELMNKNFVVAGASATEQASAMYQLTQAMASGRLQGDEYRSIIENAPLLARSIEDYMRNVQGATGSMKDWASEGLLTSDVIKAALFSSAQEIEDRFAQMPMTWGQVATLGANLMTNAFQPVIQLIGSGAQWITDNWAALEPMFYSLAAGAGVYATGLALVSVQSWVASGAASALFAALSSNPFTWLAMGAGALVYALYQWVEAVGGAQIAWGMACNVILTAFDNLHIGFMTGVYGVLDLWTMMQWGAQAAGVGVQNVLTDMETNALQTLERFINNTIGHINGFITLVNKIPGVALDVVGEATFATRYVVENEAEKAARNASLAASWETAQAEIAGHDAELSELRRVADVERALRESDLAGQRFRALQGNDAATDAFTLGSYDETSQAYLADIARNTGSVADSLRMSEEDLRYLRDLAERETVNRYTTAEITIDLSGMQNTMNNNADLDGFLRDLTDAVVEATSSAAEGVHA